ncbi:MAG TPA: DUF2203 domain-containing protein [Verrucomicrobiae bacterium]|nr:DUF2203 domain-containing protein [Verrucomicrobiae bacterium]
MAHQFRKHYTRAQARRLLPEVRQWLKRLSDLRAALEELDKRLEIVRTPGADLGGDVVNNWVRTIAELKNVLMEFFQREIQIKDLQRGLIDFPAIIGGREVFLCWEEGEEDIEFWHELDSGYSGREKLEGE